NPGEKIIVGGQSFFDPTAGIDRLPRLGEVAIDGEALVFTFVLSLLTGALFGLAPALQFFRPGPVPALQDGAAVSGIGFRFRRRRRTQNLLVIGEVALTLALLAGAGLLIRSVWRLHGEKLGFQTERVLTIQLDFPSYKYHDDAQVTSFVTQLSERLASLLSVGVRRVDFHFPFHKRWLFFFILTGGKTGFPRFFSLILIPKKGSAPSGRNPLPKAFFSEISPNYMRTLGIPLRQGREFDA